MQCTIAENNIKFLGKSVHSLLRIGDDLYIETTDNGYLLQTVNSSRSAYARFTFESPFFFKFEKSASVKCKVSLKSWLMAFRYLPSLEKIIETCIINTKSVPDTLCIEFICQKAMKKLFYVPLIENETVQADFPNNVYHCKLRAMSRLLTDGIQNFCISVEEVTLVISFDRLTLKNYVDDEPDPDKIVHTELTLESDEFEDYEVQQETEVTFCLKELRALLGFVEGSDHPVDIHCNGAGKPIMFSVECTSGMKTDFVLATLADAPSSQTNDVLKENSAANALNHTKKKDSFKNKLGGKSKNLKPTVASSCSLPEVPLQEQENSSAGPSGLHEASNFASLQVTVHDVGADNVELTAIQMRDVNKKNAQSDGMSRSEKATRFFGLQCSQVSMYIDNNEDDDDEILVPNSEDED